MKLALHMGNLCRKPMGNKTNGALALAHIQVEQKDPMRFFVFRGGKVICNPIIVNHTHVPVNKEEGCMSFADKPNLIVQRFHTIEVQYQTIVKVNGEWMLSAPEIQKVKGLEAQVIQHEIDHFNGKTIYD